MYKDEISAASLLRKIMSVLAYALLILILALFFSNNIGVIFISKGSSMKTTIDDGDVLLINTLSYKWQKPERFNLIYISGSGKGESIKRVVGLPGETVLIKDNNIYINGEKLEQSFWTTVNSMDMETVSVTLKADEYFVMGDNPSFSEDSRSKYFGPVNSNEIGGRPWFCCYPFTHLGWIE